MTVVRKRGVTSCAERNFARGMAILYTTCRTEIWNGDPHKELPGATHNNTYRWPVRYKRKSSRQPRIHEKKRVLKAHAQAAPSKARPMHVRRALRRELYLRHTRHTTRDWALSSEAAWRTGGKAHDVGTHKRMPRLLPTRVRQARRSRGEVGHHFPRSAGRSTNENMSGGETSSSAKMRQAGCLAGYGIRSKEKIKIIINVQITPSLSTEAHDSETVVSLPCHDSLTSGNTLARTASRGAETGALITFSGRTERRMGGSTDTDVATPRKVVKYCKGGTTTEKKT